MQARLEFSDTCSSPLGRGCWACLDLRVVSYIIRLLVFLFEAVGIRCSLPTSTVLCVHVTSAAVSVHAVDELDHEPSARSRCGVLWVAPPMFV